MGDGGAGGRRYRLEMTRLGRRSLLIDVSLGLGLGVSGVPGYWHQPWVVVAQMSMGVAIAVRRLLPFTASVVVSLAFVTEALIAVHTPEDQVALVGIPLIAYTVATYRPRPVALAALVILVAAVCAEIPISGSGQYWYSTGIVLVGWLPGLFMAGRRLEIHRLEDTTRRLAADRDEQAVRAVARERTLLARELHDVVSHTVGAMMIQAAAAEQVFDSAPDKARGALGEVQRTGRQAITELHQLLGLLRDEQAALRTSPPPGLGAVGDLVAAARAEGVNEITYRVLGQAHPISPALDLSGYRIVQECLTNVRKHAPGARVSVCVTWPPTAPAGCLDIDVTDTGPVSAVGPWGTVGPTLAPPPDRAPGDVGHGLVGIRERVALFGGEVSAGPVHGTGYRTHARLTAAEVDTAPGPRPAAHPEMSPATAPAPVAR